MKMNTTHRFLFRPNPADTVRSPVYNLGLDLLLLHPTSSTLRTESEEIMDVQGLLTERRIAAVHDKCPDLLGVVEETSP
jgi:hypothetical protein